MEFFFLISFFFTLCRFQTIVGVEHRVLQCLLKTSACHSMWCELKLLLDQSKTCHSHWIQRGWLRATRWCLLLRRMCGDCLWIWEMLIGMKKEWKKKKALFMKWRQWSLHSRRLRPSWMHAIKVNSCRLGVLFSPDLVEINLSTLELKEWVREFIDWWSVPLFVHMLQLHPTKTSIKWIEFSYDCRCNKATAESFYLFKLQVIHVELCRVHASARDVDDSRWDSLLQCRQE